MVRARSVRSHVGGRGKECTLSFFLAPDVVPVEAELAVVELMLRVRDVRRRKVESLCMS